MSGTTPRVGFYLPADDGSEPINVATDINDNYEKIDNVIGFVPSTSSTPPASPFNGMSAYESDTGAAKFWKASSWVQLLAAGATFLSNLIIDKTKRLGIGSATPTAIVDVIVDNVTTVPLIKLKQTAETTHRVEIDYDGFRIGGGTSAPEVRLYRPTSGQLVLDAVGVAATGGLTVAGVTALASANISGALNIGGNITSDVNIVGNLTATGQGLEKTIWKSVVSQKTSTVTLTADTDFVIPVLANTTYFIELYLITSGVGDIQLAWTGPSGISGFRWGLGMAAAGTDATSTSMRTGVHQFSTGVIYGTVSDASYSGVSETITLTTGSTAGTFALTWAQGTSNATASSIRQGSMLRYRIVA